MRLFKILFNTVVVAFVVGFVWFAESISRGPEDNTTLTDAIVVLTGGSHRLEEGFELLQEKLAPKLFISGVYPDTTVQDLKRKYHISKNFPCCVELGYQARDTVENAQETGQWVRKNRLKSLRLVTSGYHMPRSLLEFRKTLPEVKIIPHPIQSSHVRQKNWWYWPGSLSLMIREYIKFLYVYAKGYAFST